MEKKFFDCIKCNKNINFFDEVFNCKDCNKLGICSFCYLTGFPYPNICLECIQKRKKIAKQIIENEIKIKKNIQNNLNFYLFNNKL